MTAMDRSGLVWVFISAGGPGLLCFFNVQAPIVRRTAIRAASAPRRCVGHSTWPAGPSPPPDRQRVSASTRDRESRCVRAQWTRTEAPCLLPLLRWFREEGRSNPTHRVCHGFRLSRKQWQLVLLFGMQWWLNSMMTCSWTRSSRRRTLTRGVGVLELTRRASICAAG